MMSPPLYPQPPFLGRPPQGGKGGGVGGELPPQGARGRGLRGELARWLAPPEFYREREVTVANWVEGIFEPVAVVATIVCAVIGLVGFGLALVPRWETEPLIPLSIVVAAEAFLYARRLVHARFNVKEWAALLLPPFLLIRFWPHVLLPTRLLDDLPRWWSDPGTFFTFGWVVNCLILLLAWWMSFSTSLDLNRIRVQQGEMPGDESAACGYGLDDDHVRLIDHSAPLRGIANRFLWGGLLVVTWGGLTALTVAQSWDLAAVTQLVTFGRPSQHLALANVVLYYVFGFLLIGEAQYVRLRTLWRLDRLAIPSNLAPRWAAYLVGAMALILLVTMALPTDYALTLADVVSVVLGILSQILVLLVTFVYLLFSLLLWPLRLLSPGTASEQSSEAPVLPPQPPPPPPPGPPIPLLEFLRSAAFLMIGLLVVIYLLRVLWREHPPLPRWLSASPLLRGVAHLVAALLRGLARLGRQVVTTVVAALPQLFVRPVTRVVTTPRRWLSLRGLGHRDRIISFYLSVVERATQLGHPKPPAATASEYTRALRTRLPLVDPELEELTSAFLEARYGPRPVTDQGVSFARSRWQALKVKLRRA
ncbi:MAG: DUF4129 domain-containing protein [Chloroflexi bacterium]|nr:DUF4129 domain-containing protein [Chloroflexota bacterium]